MSLSIRSKTSLINVEPEMIEKTILIADDDDDLCQALALRCRRLGMKAVVANDGFRALQLAERLGPDLICLDVDMQGGNGLAVCEMLSGIRSIASTSIAILTGRRDLQTIDRCRQLGANYIHKSGNAWNELEILISEMMVPNASSTWVRLAQPNCVTNTSAAGANRSDESSLQTSLNQSRSDTNPTLETIFAMLDVDEKLLEPSAICLDRLQNQVDFDTALQPPEVLNRPWVLHVDDDADLSNALKMRLEFHGVSVVQAFTGCSGIKQAFTNPVSAIILDLGMPGGDGRYVLESLKACESTKHIPVVVLTGFRGGGQKQEMLSLGADSFLEKPIPFETLFSKLSPHLGLPKSRYERQIMTTCSA